MQQIAPTKPGEKLDTRNTGIAAAVAFAKALSDTLDQELTIEISPEGEVSYEPSTGIMRLPGVPADDVPIKAQNRLRAYHAHESWERKARKRRLSEFDDPGLKTLINGAGDAYLDRDVGREFPGAGMLIRDAVMEDSNNMKQIGGLVQASYRSVASVIRHIGEEVIGVDEALNSYPNLKPYLEKIEHILRNLEVDSEDALVEQCKEMYRLLELEEEEEEGECEGEEEGGGEGDKTRETKGGGGGEGKKQQAKLPLATAGDYNSEERIKNRVTQGLLKGDAKSRSAKDMPYTYNPLIDVVVQAHKVPQFRQVFGLRPWERDAQVLRNRLAQALTVPAPRMRRRLLKGEVDERELHRLCIGDADVMKRRLRQETDDVAVLLSIDISGSMTGEMPLVRHLVKIWVEALEDLGLANEALGWTTGALIPSYATQKQRVYDRFTENVYRKVPVSHVIIKGFNESARDPKIQTGIRQLDSAGGTPTGDGLHYAVSRLANRPERRKVLFFMTDGQPSTMGGWQSSNQPHHRFIKTTFKRANDAGIEIIPVALGMPHTHKMLTNLLPAGVKVLHVEKIEDVERQLTNELVGYLRREAREQVKK